MKKTLTLIAITLILLISVSTVCYAQGENISIEINGSIKTFDVMPVMINDRVLVPMRGIFETLGATVGWEETTETVIAAIGNDYVSLQIGNKNAFFNGDKFELDVEPQLISDRTMVPIRFVAESFGASVAWNDATNTVIISK